MQHDFSEMFAYCAGKSPKAQLHMDVFWVAMVTPLLAES